MRLAPLALATLAAAGSALAGCDTYGVDPPPVTPPVAVVDTLGPVRLDPRATYLRVADDPGATATAPVDLAALGVAPGDTLTFFVAGYADLQPTAPSPVRSRDVVGVFATSGALGAPDAPARVAGPLDAGADFVTDSTAIGRFATDVPEDFFATRATVAVPAAATHLFLAVHDVFYSDNEDVGDGVQVTLLRRR